MIIKGGVGTPQLKIAFESRLGGFMQGNQATLAAMLQAA
jgi:hypothetical protein